MSTTRREFRVTGRHVLVGLLGFFGLVIGVDVVFTVLAVRSDPGATSLTAYEDGLAYNATLETRAAQAALGWRATVEQGAPGVVTVRLTDAEGAPLDGLAVKAALRRPATAAGARTLAFRPVAPGAYRAETTVEVGAWDLDLSARDPSGRSFQAERRLVWR